MAVMFVSTKDKSMIKKTIDEIKSKVKDTESNISPKDISELKKAYKVTRFHMEFSPRRYSSTLNV